MNNNTEYLKGAVYPDLSFSIGVVPKEKKRLDDSLHDKLYEEQWNSYEYTVNKYGRTERREHRFFEGSDNPYRFNFSRESSQTKPKENYGRNGITTYGKRVIRSGAKLMQDKYTKYRLGFITCTVPNYCPENIRIIANKWNEISRLFFQKVRRLQLKRNAPTELVGCTEIQSERYKKYGVVAPHFHFIYVSKFNGYNKNYIISADEFRMMWREVLTNIVEKYGVIEVKTIVFGRSIDAKPIEKDASKYIAKYMSKGGKIIEDIKDDGYGDCLPKQWWTTSKAMKRWVKENTIPIPFKHAKTLFCYHEEYLELGLIKWCDFVYQFIDGKEVCVGMVGKATSMYYSELKKLKW